MKNKTYYVIFQVSRHRKCGTRIYLGKQITNFPRNNYMGEDDCLSIRNAIINSGSKAQFHKEIIKLCETEEEMNSEYDRLVSEALSKYKWKYYNTPHKPRTKHSDESKEKIKQTLKQSYEDGSRIPWNSGVRNYFKHSKEFRKNRSASYKGEGNPNYKNGRHVAKNLLTRPADSPIKEWSDGETLRQT